MRFSLDSNVLLYAFDRDAAAKRTIATDILLRARLLDCVVPAQVLGEMLAVVRRKQPAALGEAAALVDRYALLFRTEPTTADQIARAGLLAERHRLQFWDALIVTVSVEAGATVLLSEDMHDGLAVAGLEIVNPFDPANGARLTAILSA